MNTLKVFAGNSNKNLANKIVEYLNIELGQSENVTFSDGEPWVKYNENIRGSDVFIVQSTCQPDSNLLELLIMIDAARRASARRVTAVIPYFGYARQDRKDQPRVAITAKLVANLITTAGADRILTMDLHASQIQGFFDIPVDHLYASSVLSDYYKRMNISDLVIASPDIGSNTLAKVYAKSLNVPIVVVDKRRPRPNVTEVVSIIGDVDNKNVLTVDDMIDTGGTLYTGMKALKSMGAKDIYAACTHPILSGPAIERLKDPIFTQVLITDTIPIPSYKMIEKMDTLTVSDVFGEAILRIHNEESVSVLFD